MSSRSTKQLRLTPEEKLIAILEKRVAELERANLRLLRMVELVMEAKFYRPVVTGGVKENMLEPALPADSLSDVVAFDEASDQDLSRSQEESFRSLQRELNEIEAEHSEWRVQKGLANEEAAAVGV